MPSPYLYAKYRSRIEMHESFPPRVTAKDFENAPKVFNLLQGHEKACRGTRHLSLFGHEVCNKGWMKLVGIGKRRFLRIFNAVKNNEAVCPLDQRFIPREPKPPSVKRQAVYDFLHRLYEQAAEHLPDSNHSSSNKRPRQANTNMMTQTWIAVRFDICHPENSWTTFGFVDWRIQTSRFRRSCSPMSQSQY